jgi:hypothetical protein
VPIVGSGPTRARRTPHAGGRLHTRGRVDSHRWPGKEGHHGRTTSTAKSGRPGAFHGLPRGRARRGRLLPPYSAGPGESVEPNEDSHGRVHCGNPLARHRLDAEDAGPKTRRRIDASVLTSLAGYAAEKRFNPGAAPAHSQDDLEVAFELLSHVAEVVSRLMGKMLGRVFRYAGDVAA